MLVEDCEQMKLMSTVHNYISGIRLGCEVRVVMNALNASMQEAGREHSD